MADVIRVATSDIWSKFLRGLQTADNSGKPKWTTEVDPISETVIPSF